MGSYIPSTRAEQQEMLSSIGLKDFRELYKDVPAEVFLDNGLDLAVLEVAARLLTTSDDVDLDALGLLFLHELLGSAQGVAVEAAGQATIGRHDDDDAMLDFVVLLQQRVVLQVSVRSRGNEHVGQSRDPWQRILHAVRRTANLRRRDHFHGARNLLRRSDGVDASF